MASVPNVSRLENAIIEVEGQLYQHKTNREALLWDFKCFKAIKVGFGSGMSDFEIQHFHTSHGSDGMTMTFLGTQNSQFCTPYFEGGFRYKLLAQFKRCIAINFGIK